MVDLTGGGPDGPIEHGFSNSVFIFPAIIVISIVGFFAYKLVTNLKDKEKRKEDKKKLKQQRKEKDPKSKKRMTVQHSNNVANTAENHVREKKARG